jgi:hypothetical protein
MGARPAFWAARDAGSEDLGRPARVRAVSRMWPNRKKKPQLGREGGRKGREGGRKGGRKGRGG